MGFKRTILNILLAVMLALPIAALENRFSVNRSSRLALTASLSIQDPDYPMDRETAAFPDLVEMAGLKAGRVSGPPPPPEQFDAIIKPVAKAHQVSPALVKALIRAESNFNPGAVSPVGAVGLMQILPETARTVGVVDPLEPKSNILAGVRYLKNLLEMFEDDETMALAAYNSGPASVLKFGGIPPFPETQLFVNRVMTYYRSYLNS